MKNRHSPIPADIGSYVSYSSETGLITWTKAPHRNRPQMVGTVWSTRNQNNYVKGCFRYTQLYAHRVAWYLMTGTDPAELTVDHINGIHDDNS